MRLPNSKSKEEEELKNCTFHPNIHLGRSPKKNVDDTMKKLYLEGLAKYKNKKDEEKKEVISKDDFSFKPTINR